MKERVVQPRVHTEGYTYWSSKTLSLTIKHVQFICYEYSEDRVLLKFSQEKALVTNVSLPADHHGQVMVQVIV